jgi:hypothetical protein
MDDLLDPLAGSVRPVSFGPPSDVGAGDLIEGGRGRFGWRRWLCAGGNVLVVCNTDPTIHAAAGCDGSPTIVAQPGIGEVPVLIGQGVFIGTVKVAVARRAGPGQGDTISCRND